MDIKDNTTRQEKIDLVSAAYSVFRASLNQTYGYSREFIDGVVMSIIDIDTGGVTSHLNGILVTDTGKKLLHEFIKEVEELSDAEKASTKLKFNSELPLTTPNNVPLHGEGAVRPKARSCSLSELVESEKAKGNIPDNIVEQTYGKHKTPRPMEIEKTIYSKQDQSFNIIFKNGAEARFVRRDSKFVIYVSSQGGCKQACRFCHLTQKGLTNEYCMSAEEIEAQAFAVYKHAVETLKPFEVSRIHINFMARGDAFLNDAVFEPKLYTDIEQSFWLEGQDNWVGVVPIKYNVSTIMPDSVDIKERVRKLAQIRGEYRVDIRLYWSLYSMDGDFRRRWMPRAAAPSDVHRWISRALDHNYYMPIRTHLALIKDTNDGIDAIDAMVKFCYMIPCYEGTNIVAYNPFDDKSEETEQERIDEIMVQFRRQYSFYLDASKHLHPCQFNPIKQISRVGFDVQASCGLFHSE